MLLICHLEVSCDDKTVALSLGMLFNNSCQWTAGLTSEPMHKHQLVGIKIKREFSTRVRIELIIVLVN